MRILILVFMFSVIVFQTVQIVINHDLRSRVEALEASSKDEK